MEEESGGWRLGRGRLRGIIFAFIVGFVFFVAASLALATVSGITFGLFEHRESENPMVHTCSTQDE